MEPTGYVAVALALLVVGLAVAALRNRRGLGVILLRAAAAEESLAALQREVERDRRVADMVWETIGDGLLLLDHDGEVVLANRAVAEQLGSVPPTLGSILPLPLREGITESRRTGAAGSVLVETGAPSRWLRGAITPAAHDHTLVVIRDVTDERRLDAVRRDFVENAS
ncbi:MAG TPA: hypothetical protein VE800_09490, partial [Actinomycetota bacterium]|nr:hypothetical protein [Actinomycetota bacterium]